MTRKPRMNVPGTHHVYARGNEGRVIFRDDADRASYLRLLGATAVRRRWHCLAYCLMDNHVHLLIEIEEANLAEGLQQLHGEYGRTFNERHARSGHLFQGRYGSKLVTSDEQLWWTIAYIAWNPVKACLVRSPDEWRWSSHGAASRGRAPRWLAEDRLLDAFRGLGGDPNDHYAALLSAPPPPPEPPRRGRPRKS